MTTLDDRIAAIEATGLLDAEPSPAFERGARLAAALLGTSATHTTFVLGDRQFYPSHVGLPEPVASARETPLSYSFCRHVVDDEAPVVFDDTLEHERLAGNLAVAEFAVRTYAGVPLRAADGTVVGTVCALDFEPRRWTDEEVNLLADVADSLHTELVLRREVQRLRRLDELRLAGRLVATTLRGQAAALVAGEVDPSTTAATLDQLADALEAQGD